MRPHGEDAPRGRALLTTLYDAAVVGAAPGPLTTTALRSVEAPASGCAHLFAIGKAASAMAAAAVEALADTGIEVRGGVIVAPAAEPAPHAALASIAGDHPLPARRSFDAAQRLADAAERVQHDDLALVLLSGGASSLIAGPLPGLNEGDVARLFSMLLDSGLDIGAMNAVRKRFTRWGAGRLAAAVAPAHTEVLVVSDVPGDHPADVGSGPCAPDPCTAADVAALLERARLLGRVPAALRAHLEDVASGRAPETLGPDDVVFARVATRVVGSNRLALDAAARRAQSLSLRVDVHRDPITGAAAHVGSELARDLLGRAARGERGCVLWGGETTVRLDGDPALRGGRCQELALAASRLLDADPLHGPRVAILAAGTDGRDGPTDAAGAFADAGVWRAIERAGRDPELDLARHASYDALDAAGALFRRGLTGTNVMDVVIGVVE